MPRVSLKVVLGIFLVTQVVASGIVYDGVIAGTTHRMPCGRVINLVRVLDCVFVLLEQIITTL